MFWQNDSAGINQRPDLYSTIASKVHVYRQNVDHLSEHSIVLTPTVNSEAKPDTLPLDVLVYCTGWSPTSTFFPDNIASQLGLPIVLDRVDPNLLSKWQALDTAADSNVLAHLPALADPPPYRRSQPSQTPFRLYQSIVPSQHAEDHSVVFLGKMVVGNNFRVAEVQALWAVAYLTGHIKYDQADMEQEISKTVTWCRRRYLNKGELGSYFFFDVIDYTDMLLAQLTLSSHRRRGWFGNLFGPCRAFDLRGLLGEYRALYRALS